MEAHLAPLPRGQGLFPWQPAPILKQTEAFLKVTYQPDSSPVVPP